MNPPHLASRPRTPRFGALASAASALVLATASPALAHTGVSASDSHTLAKNVTLTFESEPENPAPLLKLKPAAPSASPSASRRAESQAPDSDGTSPSKAATSDDGSPWPAVGVIVGVCLVALAGGFVLVQQRRGAGTE
ncbi:hypothetical protein GCM10017744_098650 [Streptomyces antimycoticus]|uniref:CopC domain-containing protein n=1 Tax=Streptomyces antimycoticus TaxID=68175 RepID=A0A4D4JWD2_9ACTN|nr:hypothetical protein [Streptomyces antimycoticus]GDY40214.1 hypothetical protein SANT12839_010960 [Streptomyces antimycoticus]